MFHEYCEIIIFKDQCDTIGDETITNKEAIKIKFRKIIRDLYLCNDILEKKFTEGIAEYTNIIANLLNNPHQARNYYTESDSIKISPKTIEYREAFKILNNISQYRKELSSFCYMLKQLNPCSIRC